MPAGDARACKEAQRPEASSRLLRGVRACTLASNTCLQAAQHLDHITLLPALMLLLLSPNAVNYTLRDCMVVRACTPVAAGQELTINYLVRPGLEVLAAAAGAAAS